MRLLIEDLCFGLPHISEGEHVRMYVYLVENGRLKKPAIPKG